MTVPKILLRAKTVLFQLAYRLLLNSLNVLKLIKRFVKAVESVWLDAEPFKTTSKHWEVRKGRKKHASGIFPQENAEYEGFKMLGLEMYLTYWKGSFQSCRKQHALSFNVTSLFCFPCFLSLLLVAVWCQSAGNPLFPKKTKKTFISHGSNLLCHFSPH